VQSNCLQSSVSSQLLFMVCCFNTSTHTT